MQSKKRKNTRLTLRAKQQATNAALFTELQQQFEQWRTNRSGHEPVPPTLCQAAIRAIDNGMSFSKLGSLGIKHSQLKRWRLQQAEPSKTTPQFVAVEPINNSVAMTNNIPQTTACEFELAIHYPHGLRVDIRVCDATAVAQLLKTLY